MSLAGTNFESLPEYNALTGPIPSEIGLLTSLTNLEFCKLL
jgi:hypothetical protein